MSLILLLSITTMLSAFVTGIIMLLALTERNRLQMTLVLILGVFSAIMLMGIINLAKSPNHIYIILDSPLRFRFLSIGFIAFFPALTYYMVAAHRNLLTLKNGILFISPVIITLIIYIWWHKNADIPLDYRYTSLTDIWENRFTIPVILRVLLYFFFLLYEGVMIYNMWNLDSLRSKHSILNSPDAVSNIRWLRMVVIGTIIVLILFSIFVFIPTFSILMLYIVVTILVFIYFIYNAIARRMYEDTEGWQATWTLKDGWKIIKGKSKQTEEPLNIEENTNTQPQADINSLHEVDRWMKQEKPFCHAEFSVADIIKHFPDIDYTTLSELLHLQNDSPQAYIRRHRIDEACRIIQDEKEVKVTELASQVGFSHNSSFSRAFSAVMGETVIQYMNRVGAKRKFKNRS